MPLPDATDKVASPPQESGNWRDHISFWFGIVGTIIGVVGVVLSVYFYQASKIQPLLTFAVNPLKTELQRPDYDKDLAFFYKDKPVGSESITSVQVSIWNAGTKSIRNSDVLAPIRLVMPDGAAILSVRLKKVSRPICGFELHDNQEDYKFGKCRLNWLILEPGDGAVLQIIYAGSAQRDPDLEGAVEGQKDGIAVEKYNVAFNGRGIERSSIPMTQAGSIIVLMVVGILLLLAVNKISAKSDAAKKLAEKRAKAEKRLNELKKIALPVTPLGWVLIALAMICFLVVLAEMFFGGSPPGPPFGW